MAPRPTYIAAQPPPELPADPKLSEMTSQYLRTFALWCRNGFAAKLDSGRALPGVMIQAVDATTGLPINAVYMLTNSAGVVSAVQIGLGGPNPQVGSTS